MRTSRFILFPILFIFHFYGSAQMVIDPLWEKIEESPIGLIAEGWGVDVDSDGNVYWPFNVNTNNEGLDIVCYKFDSDGNELWTDPLIFGGPGAQQSYVANAKSDFLYIGGRYCETNGLDCEMQLIKVNKTNGTIVWAQEYDFGNNGYDEIDGLEIRDNAIYLGGWGQALEPGPFRNDMGLLKSDLDGNEIWSNHLGELNTGEHLDGHFVVDDNFIYGCGLWNGSHAFNLYNGHAFLGKFSKTDGSLVDSTLFGSQSNDLLDIENALGMTTDGEFLYITGYTTPPGLGNWQMFIAKYDKDLNEIWYRDWGGTGTETARGIVVQDGIVYVAGLTQSPELATQGGADAVLVEYDTEGTFLAYRIWGDSQDNTFRDITKRGDEIYLSGAGGEDLLTFGGSSEEAFLIKTLTRAALGVEDNTQSSSLIQLSPNPVDDVLLISSEVLISEVSVYDIAGRVMIQKRFSTSETYMLNLKALPTAIYFAKIATAEGIFVKRLIKQ